MIAPMLAADGHVTSLEHYIFDDNWLMEQKLDGHRLLLRSPDQGESLTAITRGGTPYSHRLPLPLTRARFPKGEWVLDGELVDGTYWAFDLLIAAGQDLTKLPQVTRRIWLVNALATFRHPFKVVPQAESTDDKIRLAERSLSENFEGLVLKRADATYRYNQRSNLWLKVKFTHTVDVIAMAVRDDGKESVRLGAYTDGELVEIGRASLLGKEKARAITPGMVVEVKYLNLGNAGRLVQPTVLRVRDDKAPQECTTDQLKTVNKAVLESL
jgi:ATP-dependent DNA ligase